MKEEKGGWMWSVGFAEDFASFGALCVWLAIKSKREDLDNSRIWMVGAELGGVEACGWE